MIDALIKENKLKKWNSDRVNIYEILAAMCFIAHGNYY